ncbi:MAG TPA: hypothetical protein PKK59_04910 [Anaerolineaceae bacterium]|nr:hypothetical protein [Anaerolineaceae bacterium]
MNTNEPILSAAPPRLFTTILKGFNTVAGQVHLILLPVLVDLFLWLGPKLHIYELFEPTLKLITANMLKLTSSDMLDTMRAATTLYTEMLQELNLFSAIRTLPVGVPSLIARLGEVNMPLNYFGTYEVDSLRVGVAALGGLIMLGFFIGTVYFNALARHSQQEAVNFSWKKLINQYAQTLVFFLILVALLIAISIPLLILVSILSLISAGLAQFVIVLVGFMALWLVLPLVFSPHGIFALDQKVVPSMLLSLRMVRFFLPGTSFFILVCILISEGLNMVWTLPGTDSWLMLVGIGGHAFIVTGLLAASFLYYRDGIKWMQYNIQKMTEAVKKQESGGTPDEQQ